MDEEEFKNKFFTLADQLSDFVKKRYPENTMDSLNVIMNAYGISIMDTIIDRVQKQDRHEAIDEFVNLLFENLDIVKSKE